MIASFEALVRQFETEIGTPTEEPIGMTRLQEALYIRGLNTGRLDCAIILSNELASQRSAQAALLADIDAFRASKRNEFYSEQMVDAMDLLRRVRAVLQEP